MYRLTIDGYTIDLATDQTIALSFKQKFGFEAATKILSYTNEIDLLDTDRNRKFFGYYKNMSFGNIRVVRRRLSCVLMYGSELVFEGVCNVREIKGKYRVSIFSKEVDLFESLDLSLKEVDTLLVSQGTWSMAYMDSRRDASSGIVCPFYQAGQLGSFYETNIPAAGLDEVYLPCVYIKTLFEELCAYAGRVADIPFDDKFNRLILLWSSEEWLSGSTISYADICPDENAADFVRNIMQHFGMRVEDDGRNAVFSFLKDYTNPIDMHLLNGKNAIIFNASSKRYNESEKVTVDETYRQYNIVTYGQGLVFPTISEVGNHSAMIESNAGDGTETVFESMFKQNVDDYLAIDVDVVQEEIYTVAVELVENTPAGYSGIELLGDNMPNIALVREKFASEPTVYYNGNARTDYLCCNYWLDSDRNNTPAIPLEDYYNTLRWKDEESASQALIPTYYATLAEWIENPFVVERSYILTFSEFIFIRTNQILYDRGKKFFVIEGNNWVKERPCNLKLIPLF